MARMLRTLAEIALVLGCIAAAAAGSLALTLRAGGHL